MGLRRGFVEVGEQNLVMSLWPISDEFTFQIMSDFYGGAHQSGNAPEAFAKVQGNWQLNYSRNRALKSERARPLQNPFIRF
jgi:CHAT domain-containing protein